MARSHTQHLWVLHLSVIMLWWLQGAGWLQGACRVPAQMNEVPVGLVPETALVQCIFMSCLTVAGAQNVAACARQIQGLHQES